MAEPASTSRSFQEFFRQAPKPELHVHLRGAMPAKFFAKLLRKYPPREALARAPEKFVDAFERCDNIRPFLHQPGAQPVETLFRYRSFDQFLATYLFSSYFCRDVTDFRGLVAAVRSTLQKQNIVYAEVTVSIFEYVNQGIRVPELAAALDEAAAAPGVRVQWIVDLVRDIGVERGTALLREILNARPAGLAGITLGGSEHKFPPAQFAPLYRLARDHGLRLTVHAGEAAGPQSVWDAIRALEVDRIGHGVRAIEDEKLVAYLAEHQIPLEVCPTSNICTGVFPSYDEHALKALHEAGVPITLSTDDPTFFRTTLEEEYLHAREMGIGEEDLAAILKNGFRYAFLPEKERRRYIDNIDQSRIEAES